MSKTARVNKWEKVAVGELTSTFEELSRAIDNKADARDTAAVVERMISRNEVSAALAEKSGGAVASIAAGLTPLAIGTDAGTVPIFDAKKLVAMLKDERVLDQAVKGGLIPIKFVASEIAL